MPWSYTNVEKTIVTDGVSSIPLGVASGESRRLKVLIEAGLEIADYAQPVIEAETPTYTLRQLVQKLIARGIVPPPNGA